MPIRKVNKEFRIELTIYNIIDDSAIWIKQTGEYASGVKGLREALSRCVNEANNFITYKIEKKEKPETLGSLKK